MIRIALACALLAGLWFQTQAAVDRNGQRPAFRTTADVVSVNVSVRTGNQPAAGLTSADFTVLDNGVPQRIRDVEIAGVPVDVTLLVGVNGSLAGELSSLRAETVAIARLLRPEDRLRVLEFGTDVVEVFPLRPLNATSDLALLEASFKTAPADAGGWVSVYDALGAAMLLPTVPDRRQLVVALTRPNDSMSVLSRAKTLEIAKRTEATVHIQMFAASFGVSRATPVAKRLFGSFPYLLTGESDSLHAAEAMSEIARATGGQAYEPGLLGRSAVEMFDRIFRGYRQSYLLQYELAGVPREGWHDIEVKVTRPGRFNLNARKGYFIDASPQ